MFRIRRLQGKFRPKVLGSQIASALLILVLATGISGVVFENSAGAAAGDCAGFQGITTRQVRYTSDGVLHLVGCGQTFTPSDVANAISSGTAVGNPPADSLKLTNAGSKTWLLKVNLKVEEGATFKVWGDGAGGDVNWLRLHSTPTKFVYLRTENGNLLIKNSKVTSWDSGLDAVDNTVTDGRAYVAARTVYNGRPTTPVTSCSVNGGTQDANEARMDVISSEMSYLGSYNAESYGVTWKVYSKTPPAGRTLYDITDVFGTVTDSKFDNNYFGTYTYGGYCMKFDGNTYENNHKYGLDPHDDSDSLTITNNIFRSNGDHGLICSVFCSDIKISNNESYDNLGHGIMIHRQVNGAIISNNISKNNEGSGIAIFDSQDAMVTNNTVVGNLEAGLRLSVGSKQNTFIGNTVSSQPSKYSTPGPLLKSFLGSDIPTLGTTNRMANNSFSANVFNSSAGPIGELSALDNTNFTGNSFSGNGTAFILKSNFNTNFGDNDFSAGISTEVDSENNTTATPSVTLSNHGFNKSVEVKNTTSRTNWRDTQGYIGQISGGAPVAVTASGATATWTNTRSVTTRNLRIVPTSGTVSVVVTGWSTSPTSTKTWTESSPTNPGATNHRIGGLSANACYSLIVNGVEVNKSNTNANGVYNFSNTVFVLGSTNTFALQPASSCSGGGGEPIEFFTEDFEANNLSKWGFVRGVTIDTNSENTGTYGARVIAATNSAYARTDFSPRTSLIADFDVRLDSMGNNSVAFTRFRDSAGNSLVNVGVRSSGFMGVQVGSGSTITTSFRPTLGEWVRIQVSLTINGTSGNVVVKANGNTIHSAVANTGTAPITRFQMGDATSTNVFNAAYDNIVLR